MTNNNKTTAIIVWLIGALFYAYQYVLRVIPNLLIPELTAQFNINSGQFGQISGVYYLGYSLMHIPVGIMLDRFKLKYILPIMIIISAIGMVPLIITDMWVYPLLGRFILGCGSTAAILGLFKIISNFFPQNLFARMLSIAVTIGLTGAIYGGAPLNILIAEFGWQAVIKGLIYLGGALAIAFYICIPNLDNQNSSNQTPFKDVIMVLSNRKVMLFCIAAGLMVGPLEGFADVWGKQFFQNVHDVNNTTSATLTSLIFIGMCFGAPFVSGLAEKFNKYLLGIIICNFVMLIGFGLLLGSKLEIPTISTIMVLVGIASSYQILAITMACKFIDSKFTALTSAIANMIIMIFGYIFHTAIGATIQFSKAAGQNINDQYIAGISVIPILMLSGLVMFISSGKSKNSQSS